MFNLIQRSKKLKNRKGFTLIELIVVIAILGILAAVMVPQLSGFTAKAQKAQVLTNAAAIGTAADSIKVEGSTLNEATIMGLAGLTPGVAGANDGTLTLIVAGAAGDAVAFTYQLGTITVTRNAAGKVE